MTRELLAMYNECDHELDIRRSNGQKLRRRVNQIPPGHQVFTVQTSGNDIWIFTGPRGSRQPTRRLRFTDTGVYRGNSAF